MPAWVVFSSPAHRLRGFAKPYNRRRFFADCAPTDFVCLPSQKALVQNAQEGLHQSLAILQRASSKVRLLFLNSLGTLYVVPPSLQEEQESARVQVRSLLSRAEELVLSLQVMHEIRTEMAHVQKELLLTKAAHKDVSHCA